MLGRNNHFGFFDDIIMEDRYLETYKTWNKIAQLYEDSFMDLEIYNDSNKRF